MATLKGSKATDGAQPRLVEAGCVSVKSTYDLANGALSAGDVLQMVKIPHGAIIDDVKVVMGGTNNDTKIVAKIGDGNSATRFFGSASLSLTQSAIISMSDGLGYQYNLSDDAADQFDTIDITVGTVTSATATGTVTMMVQYHCDEADPA
jgi:hypothetical protein